jgi:hypothetical protein
MRDLPTVPLASLISSWQIESVTGKQNCYLLRMRRLLAPRLQSGDGRKK